MKIFAVGDLHLSHSGEKPMDIFGSQWKNHADKIAENWKALVGEGDLVLIPGDLSWAMHLEEAAADLQWINELPGKKVLLKGNHDYWWPGISRLRTQYKDSSLFFLQNDSFTFGQAAIGGTRLWDAPDIDLPYFDPLQNPTTDNKPALNSYGSDEERAREEKIFKRELGRLELSLASMDRTAPLRIVMTHFPPTNESGKDTILTRILEAHKINICVFGHLHSLELPYGKTWDYEKNHVRYVLVSCDAVKFSPYFLTELNP